MDGNLPEISEGRHLIGEIIGKADGATLIIFGGIHGNEAAGVKAMRRVLPQVEKLQSKVQGRVYFLAGNTRALAKNVRFIDTDFNRHWSEENISRKSPDKNNLPQISEDSEQREILEILSEILKTAQNEIFVVDLHSTSAEGLPFATVGDTLRNRHFAQKFPVTFLLGIEEQLEGTLLEYLNNQGCVTLGYEGGQHFADTTIDSHEAFICLALVNSGCLKKEDFPDYEKRFEALKRANGRTRIVEIRHREAVNPEADGFKMRQGYENFQLVKKGENLAHNLNGSIHANEAGMIIMPLYQKQGGDGFFLGREVAPFWIKLSEILRMRNFGKLMHLLPGVSNHPTRKETLVVNTNIAKFFPLQIFHLLGFRKLRFADNHLVVSKRLFDVVSPFVRNNNKTRITAD